MREGRCSSPQGAGPPRPPTTHHLPEPIRRLVTSHLKAITTDKKSINPARSTSPANTHRDRAQSVSAVRRHIVIQGESININQILEDTREDVRSREELWVLAQTLKNIRQQTVTANEVCI